MMDLDYDIDEDRAAQIGMIVLQADETIEMDMRRLLPAQAELLVSRVPSGQEVTSASLSAMESSLTGSAALMPEGARFSAIGYGCTSGTAEIGAARIRELVQAGARTPAVTDPLSALIAACAHLGLHRIGVLSPYVAEVSQTLCDTLSEAGIEVGALASFNQSTESLVARISQGSIHRGAHRLSRMAHCDAIFLSCTNLRTLPLIEPLEAELGLPVLSSNLVLGWHLMRLSGLSAPEEAPGQLWRG